MATLTMRNLDQVVVDRLKALAKANNRSLEAEARTILEGRVPVIDRAALRDHVDRIAAMAPKNVKQTDSTILIREDRDGR